MGRRRRFLEAIVDEPDRPSSHYPQKAAISNRKAQQIRKKLVEAGVLREERVNTNARGMGSNLLIVTELGLEALETINRETPQKEGEDG
jgi:DNA-binding Lrp family transcriptional regulator